MLVLDSIIWLKWEHETAPTVHHFHFHFYLVLVFVWYNVLMCSKLYKHSLENIVHFNWSENIGAAWQGTWYAIYCLRTKQFAGETVLHSTVTVENIPILFTIKTVALHCLPSFSFQLWPGFCLVISSKTMSQNVKFLNIHELLK